MPPIDAVVTTMHLQQQVSEREDAAGHRCVSNENSPAVDVWGLSIQGVSLARLGELGAAAARKASLRHFAAGRETNPPEDDA